MAPKGYYDYWRATYGNMAASGLVPIVFVDGPANGAPNPELTPRVLQRSVSVAAKKALLLTNHRSFRHPNASVGGEFQIVIATLT